MIITYDIETRNINNSLTPYCVCIYDGTQSYSFYLSDYDSVNSMLNASIKHLLNPIYNKHKIYVHNLSYFDGIFILPNY